MTLWLRKSSKSLSQHWWRGVLGVTMEMHSQFALGTAHWKRENKLSVTKPVHLDGQ